MLQLKPQVYCALRMSGRRLAPVATAATVAATTQDIDDPGVHDIYGYDREI